jgi:phosphoenolpyruvate phosphomutase
VLTEDRPKAMIEIAGKPLLERTVDTLNSIGIKDITVVRGYRKEAIQLPGLSYVDNDEHETTQEAYSLFKGLDGITGPVLMAYGDVLFQKFVPMHLFESDSDFCIAVEPKEQSEVATDEYRDFVTADRPFHWSEFDQRTELVRMSTTIPSDEVHGEWIGLLKMTADGVAQLRELGASLDPARLRALRMAEVFDLLVASGRKVEVVYVRGHWLDVDDMHDVVAASNFDASGQYR